MEKKLAIHGGKPAIDFKAPDELFTWPILTKEDEDAALDVIRLTQRTVCNLLTGLFTSGRFMNGPFSIAVRYLFCGTVGIAVAASRTGMRGISAARTGGLSYVVFRVAMCRIASGSIRRRTDLTAFTYEIISCLLSTRSNTCQILGSNVLYAIAMRLGRAILLLANGTRLTFGTRCRTTAVRVVLLVITALSLTFSDVTLIVSPTVLNVVSKWLYIIFLIRIRAVYTRIQIVPLSTTAWSYRLCRILMVGSCAARKGRHSRCSAFT